MGLLDRIKRLLTSGPIGTAIVGRMRTGQTGLSPGFAPEWAVRDCTSWVYAAASINAKAAARVPLRLYVRKRMGEKVFRSRPVAPTLKSYLLGRDASKPTPGVLTKAEEWGGDFEVVSDPHPSLELLSRFNDVQYGLSNTVNRFLSLELAGNAYVVVVANRFSGRPDHLWLIPPQYMRVIPGDPDAGISVAGYSAGGGANRVTFQPEDVGHSRYPSLDSVYYGMGKVQAAWSVVQQNRLAHAHDLGFYANGARPDYAVLAKSGTSQAEVDRFEARLRNLLRNAEDAGNFVTLTGDVTLFPLQWTPKDLGDRQQIVEEISVIFGVPRDKLLGNATYANASMADSAWLRDTIHPMCLTDEDMLNAWYLPLWGIGDDAFLAYDNPVPEDQAKKLETQRTAGGGRGWMTVNELRALDNLEPIEGGDKLPDPTPGVVPTQAPAQFQFPFTVNRGRKAAAIFDPVPEKRIGTYRQRFESALSDAVSAVVSRMRSGKAKATPPIDQLRKLIKKALGKLPAELEAVLQDMANQVVPLGGGSAWAQLQYEGTFDTQNPAVVRYAREYVPKLARTMTETLAADIENVVSNGLEAGHSMGELAHDIEEHDAFRQDGIANRSEMIARTETARAYREGQTSAWEQTGLVEEKEWVASPDCCEFCQRMNGKKSGLRDAFAAKGTTIMGADGGSYLADYEDVGGPPLHPSCRCAMVPVVKETE